MLRVLYYLSVFSYATLFLLSLVVTLSFGGCSIEQQKPKVEESSESITTQASTKDGNVVLSVESSNTINRFGSSLLGSVMIDNNNDLDIFIGCETIIKHINYENISSIVETRDFSGIVGVKDGMSKIYGNSGMHYLVNVEQPHPKRKPEYQVEYKKTGYYTFRANCKIKDGESISAQNVAYLKGININAKDLMVTAGERFQYQVEIQNPIFDEPLHNTRLHLILHDLQNIKSSFKSVVIPYIEPLGTYTELFDLEVKKSNERYFLTFSTFNEKIGANKEDFAVFAK